MPLFDRFIFVDWSANSTPNEGAAADAAGWPVNVRDGLGTKDKSRRLRRQAMRSFEHMLDLNGPSQPALVRPPAVVSGGPRSPIAQAATEFGNVIECTHG